MSSLVLDVLKAWRDALRFVEEHPTSPMRGLVENRAEQLRGLYQKLATEPTRVPGTAAEAERLIVDTMSLVNDAAAPVATGDGEWY